ncbi:MAG: SBBP repeat-containing protein [Acidobacteriota bacterium]
MSLILAWGVRQGTALGIFWTLVVGLQAALPTGGALQADALEEKRWKAYLQSPMIFEPSRGRWQDSARFVARGHRYGAALTPQSLLLTFAPAPTEEDKPATRLAVRFAGSNSQVKMSGEEKLAARIHSFTGNDPSGWRKNLSAFASVRYSGLYPGIDLRVQGRQRLLQFDFMVAPWADAANIELAFEPASGLSLDKNGDLLIQLDGGTIRQHRPYTYQLADGRQQPVQSRYRILENGHVGFEVADYDRSRRLVIDPVVSYSSYLGGSAVDSARDLVLDGSGGLYITGATLSSDFLVQNPAQQSNAGRDDAFVTKLDASTFEVIYSTYLGGSREDRGQRIAVDGSGRVYVAGQTFSFNFPLVNSLQPFRRGSNDVFLSQLDAQGGELLFSTYFGGGGDDFPTILRFDGQSRLCLAGHTNSIDFPLVEPIQAMNRGNGDIFFSQFNASHTLIFSTYLGGSSRDRVYAMFVDPDGSFALTGETASADFPLAEPFQDELRGHRDAFVTRIDPGDKTILLSSYLGGSGLETGRGVAIDSFDHLLLIFDTTSDDLPVINAFQAENAGGSDLFIIRLSPAGNVPIFASYLGGSSDDFLIQAIVDSTNRIHLAGNTRSTDFPTLDPSQGANAGGLDGFLTLAGQELLFSTYLGGSGDDQIAALALDSRQRLLTVGETSSSDFPLTPNALRDALSGASDGFLAVVSPTFILNFAQFGDGSGEGASFRSQIELLNLSAQEAANVRVILRNDSGQPFAVDLNGTPVEGVFEGTVPAAGNLRLETDGQGPLMTGSVQVISDIRLAGFILFDAGAIGATGVGSSPALQGFAAPVRTSATANTGVALMGLSAGQQLDLALFDDQGVEQARATIALPAFSHTALFVTEIDWSAEVDFSNFNGNLTATGSADFAATAILTQPGRFIILPVAELER